MFHIVNNAPGTASPIPGLLAPFAFNPPLKVVLALAFAVIGGTAAGLAGSVVFKSRVKIPALSAEAVLPVGLGAEAVD